MTDVPAGNRSISSEVKAGCSRREQEYFIRGESRMFPQGTGVFPPTKLLFFHIWIQDMLKLPARK
jgi:hypothetical protein